MSVDYNQEYEREMNNASGYVTLGYVCLVILWIDLWDSLAPINGTPAFSSFFHIFAFVISGAGLAASVAGQIFSYHLAEHYRALLSVHQLSPV